MTSKPASRAATAICSAPLEWPSRPGLATSRRGGPPVLAARGRGGAVIGGHSSPRRPPTAASGGGAEFTEALTQRAGPLPCRAAGMGQGDGGLHDVAVGPLVLGHS